jgi:N-acetylglucosamine-6-phosphate deacetylase
MTPFHHRRRDFRRLLDSRFVAGMPGRLEGGVVRRPDGRLAGSAVPALGLVRNLATSGAPPTVEAFEAMSRRPGDLLGRADLGGLEPGAFADLPGFDGDGTLGETWVGGRRLYAKEAGWFVV